MSEERGLWPTRQQPAHQLVLPSAAAPSRTLFSLVNGLRNAQSQLPCKIGVASEGPSLSTPQTKA